jgi:Ca2+-binding RTX toxin-like protein
MRRERPMGGRLVVLTAMATMVLCTGTAQATTVTASTIAVGINDTTGVTDNLTVTFRDASGTHEIVVSDASQALTPGGGCVQGVSAGEVVCTHPTAGGVFNRVNVALQAGDDRLTAATVDKLGIDVNAGTGNDTITGTSTNASTVSTGSQAVDNLDGGAGNDSITTGAGDDTALGGADDDVLIPSTSGAQHLSGGLGTRDVANYSAYTSGAVLHVGGGAVSGSSTGSEDTGVVRAKDQIEPDIEELRAGSGADALTGDADPERFDGGAGADTIDGNDGIDVVTYERRVSVGVKATLGGAAAPGGNEDTIADVENLIGGGGGDTLTGDGGPNLLEGRGGNDTLNGNDGDDVMIGGFGADSFNCLGGVDEVSYRDRSDRVTVTMGTNGASGNEDDGLAGSRDTVPAGIERLVGSSDDDLLIGSDSANRLQGGGGADELRGQGGNDVLQGGPGPDSLKGGLGRDVVSYEERPFAKPVSVTIGSAGASGGRDDGVLGARDTVDADVEDLLGGAGHDTLVGSSLGNVLDGGPGGDTMQGLGGTDVVSYATRTNLQPVSVTVGALRASGGVLDSASASARDTIDVDVETVRGGAGIDTLRGADGAQRLEGGPGDDTFDGARGPDVYVGGDGNDTASYASASGAVTAAMGVAGGSGTGDDGPPGARDTVSLDVERLVGSSNADDLTGSANADQIVGGDGNDTIRGAGGNDNLDGGILSDTLEGGTGDDDLSGDQDNDVLDGGTGADIMNGGSSSATQGLLPGDTVLYDDRTTAVTVIAEGGAVSGNALDVSGANMDTVANLETIVGGTGSDTIQGTTGGVARLIGGFGNDTLTGGPSSDELFGGQGQDTLDGGATGNDLLDGGTERDVMTGNEGNDTLTGGAGSDDLLAGNGLDVLTGGSGTDLLNGGAGEDDLDGGTENDRLIGGFGPDLIDGGGGVDVASYIDRAAPGGANAVVATIGDPGGSGNADDGAEGFRDTIATDVENLLGGIGGDTLTGNGAANEITGGGGFDTIRGGHGVDTLRGGTGNDTLLSRDASSDNVFCDANTDRAEVDAADTAAADCETVVVG